MNNSAQLLLSLQEYIVELQTENKALKSHIFSLQNRLESISSTHHDEIEKLRLHIDHCENEIIKRENREVGMIELIQELEAGKDQISRERDIYIQEIQSLRREVAVRQEEIVKLGQHQVKQAQALPPPPKVSKCKNCETYIKNQQILHNQIKEQQLIINSLRQDITCLGQFI